MVKPQDMTSGKINFFKLIIVRWAIGVRPSGYLELQLQSLPAPKATVESRPILRQDNIAIVTHKSWALNIDFFEGVGPVNGPVPTIFAEDVEATRTQLAEPSSTP
jgi:hypothetical protein